MSDLPRATLLFCNHLIVEESSPTTRPGIEVLLFNILSYTVFKLVKGVVIPAASASVAT